MEKYENNDPNKPKETKPKKEDKKESVSGGPSSAAVQDMELKILQGNNLADASDKAADDDLFGEILEKYSSASKKDKDTKILTKDNAYEACAEIYEKKMNVDSFEKQEEIKKAFNKVWEEHDNLKKGYIDFSEGYSMVQEMLSGEWSPLSPI